MFYFPLWFKAGASGSQGVFAALHKYFLAHRRCEAKETRSFTVSLLSNRPTISCRWFTVVAAAHGKGLRADVTQRRRRQQLKTGVAVLQRRKHQTVCTPFRAFIPSTELLQALRHTGGFHFSRCIANLAVTSIAATLSWLSAPVRRRYHSLTICSRISLEHTSER